MHVKDGLFIACLNLGKMLEGEYVANYDLVQKGNEEVRPKPLQRVYLVLETECADQFLAVVVNGCNLRARKLLFGNLALFEK